MDLVYFVYGLSFFLLGFSILIKNRKDSELRLANSLIYLALFGILHGFYEWGYIFISLQEEILSLGIIKQLCSLRIIIEALSYAFFFYFGVHLLFNTKQRYKWLLGLPWIVFAGWIILYIHFGLKINADQFNIWLNSADAWARYLLALPGVMIVCYSLLLQVSALEILQNKKIIKNLYAFIVFVTLYGIVGGLIVPKNVHFLGNYINTNNFFAIFKIPVQIFRASAGMGMTYCLVGILKMYDIEYHCKLERIKKEKAILNERNRISRNLHDGIIQSIYGVGLGLENAMFLIDDSPEEAKEELRTNISRLNRVITNIRDYIMDLKPKILETTNLYQLLKELLANLDVVDININFNYNVSPEIELFPEYINDIYHILQEILSNICRHSEADNIWIKVINKDGLELIVEDDGIGFDTESLANKQDKHQGLNNIKERTESLDGKFKLNSTKGEGTVVRINIPYGVIKSVYGENNIGG